ncbi:longevity-assurance protein [Cryptosporidium andersoni]|uniref:Longevity-assurance protein n=1 Tax=Cryptosporidium andersoni TaxID=117008 RepID=A0A1J4MV13_9CRYT|nr:longevity-assurance protein [Cryptosporidium andersoni]
MSVKVDTFFGVILLVTIVWTVAQWFSLTSHFYIERSASGQHLLDLCIASCCICGVIIILYYWTKPYLESLADSAIDGQLPYRVREAKIQRSSTMAFRMFYFIFASLYASVILFYYNIDWLPPELLGNGKTGSYWVQYTMIPVSRGLVWYYYLSGGYFLFSLFCLLNEEPLQGIWENILLIVIACLLLAFSFTGDFIRVGVIVLFLHNVCDILTCGCKVFVDTKWQAITLGLFGILLAAWAYLRIYCFSRIVLYPVYGQISLALSTRLCAYSTFLLMTLLLVNIYWFILMLKMGWWYIYSGQAKDIHSRIIPNDSLLSLNNTSGSESCIVTTSKTKSE